MGGLCTAWTCRWCRSVCASLQARHGRRLSHPSAVPIGVLMGSALGKYATPYISWRGLFAVGMVPGLLTLLIRAWVPESPRWLIQMGRIEEARKSLAWALEIDPAALRLDAAPPEGQKQAMSRHFQMSSGTLGAWRSRGSPIWAHRRGITGLPFADSDLACANLRNHACGGVRPTDLCQFCGSVRARGIVLSFGRDWPEERQEQLLVLARRS